MMGEEDRRGGQATAEGKGERKVELKAAVGWRIISVNGVQFFSNLTSWGLALVLLGQASPPHRLNAQLESTVHNKNIY